MWEIKLNCFVIQKNVIWKNEDLENVMQELRSKIILMRDFFLISQIKSFIARKSSWRWKKFFFVFKILCFIEERVFHLFTFYFMNHFQEFLSRKSTFEDPIECSLSCNFHIRFDSLETFSQLSLVVKSLKLWLKVTKSICSHTFLYWNLRPWFNISENKRIVWISH